MSYKSFKKGWMSTMSATCRPLVDMAEDCWNHQQSTIDKQAKQIRELEAQHEDLCKRNRYLRNRFDLKAAKIKAQAIEEAVIRFEPKPCSLLGNALMDYAGQLRQQSEK